MHLVVGQLAQIAGRQPQVEGGLDTAVSGRFSGTLSEILSSLSADYPVLFDLTDDSLQAGSSDEQSNASIPLAGRTLQKTYQTELLGSVLPGNTLEFRDDEVRLTGHPAFVKRTARRIAETLADDDAKVGAKVKAGADDTAAAQVVDAGSDEMLADIEDEARAPADQATLSRPIRWVTDIPGYDTF
jgi:hypothetical protein